MTHPKRIDPCGRPIRSVHAFVSKARFLTSYAPHWPTLAWSMALHGPYAIWAHDVDSSGTYVAAFAKMSLAEVLEHAREWGEEPAPPPDGARVLAFLDPPGWLARDPSVRRIHVWLTPDDVETVANLCTFTDPTT